MDSDLLEINLELKEIIESIKILKIYCDEEITSETKLQCMKVFLTRLEFNTNRIIQNVQEKMIYRSSDV